MVSAERAATGAERGRLEATGALIVDMESWWLAAGAADRPLAVVRVVVDTPGRELRNPLATASGGLRALRALRRLGPALDRWAQAADERRVLLAGPRSFCAGVERAIEIVERALDRYGAPVYVRKQIVHNVHVVRDLEDRGAVFVEALAEVPEGANVVFSAHGVSPEVRDEALARRLHVIDATCPLVTKVHAEARRFAKAGYTIFLIGHDGHEEVEGTTGEAPEAIRLVDGSRGVDVSALPDAPEHGKVAFLTQTTLAVDEVDEVVSHLRQRFPLLAGPGSDDICYATQNRQDAVQGPGPRVRPSAGDRLGEQLELPPPGRGGRPGGLPFLPDRRREPDRTGVDPGRAHDRGDGRGVGAREPGGPRGPGARGPRRRWRWSIDR